MNKKKILIKNINKRKFIRSKELFKNEFETKESRGDEAKFITMQLTDWITLVI